MTLRIRITRYIVLACCLLLPAAADVSPALMQEQADLYAGLRMQPLRASGLAPELQDWAVGALGGCPAVSWIFPDLRGVRLSSRKKETAAGAVAEWIVEFDGVWDWQGIRDCLLPLGYQQESYRGVPLLVPGDNRPKASAAAHWQGEVLYLGSRTLLRGAIDRLLDGTGNGGALEEKARELEGRFAVWAAGTGSPLDYGKRVSDDTRKMVPAPRQYWLGLTAGDSYSLEVSIQMMTPEEAAAILKLLSILPALSKLGPAEESVQQEMYRVPVLRVEDTTVRLQLQLPSFTLWEWLGTLNQEGKSARFGVLSRPRPSSNGNSANQ